MRNRIASFNEIDFLFPFPGRRLEVQAFGKVIWQDFFEKVHVEQLHVQVYQYRDADDIDGIELLRSDIPEIWDRIESCAVNKLCDDSEAA